MNEASGPTVADASGGGRNGTVQTGVTFATGRFGNAAQFGNQGYLSVAHDAALSLTDLTIEMWIKASMTDFTATGADAGFGLVSKRSTNTVHPYIFMIHPGGALRLNGRYGSVWHDAVTPANVVQTQQWRHIAASRTIAGSNVTITFYVNGVEVYRTTEVLGTLVQNAEPLWIGKDPYFSSFTNQGTFQGLMDEVRISNIARSPQGFNLQLPPVALVGSNNPSRQVTLTWQNGGGAVPLKRYNVYSGTDSNNVTLYSAHDQSTSFTTAPLSPGTYYWRVTATDSTDFESAKSWAVKTVVTEDLTLVAHYPFNMSANDESDYAHDGVTYGANLATDRFGNSLSAFSFNGTNAYVEVADIQHLRTPSAFTLSAWIQLAPNSTSISQAIITKGVDQDLVNADYSLMVDRSANPPQVRMHLNTGGTSGWHWHNGATSLDSLRWYHVVTTFDGSTSKIYLDGQLDGQLSVSGPLVSTAEPLKIGVYGPARDLAYFAGLIDDIRIYNRALSAAEVDSLYRLGGWPLDAPPTAPQNLTASAGDRQISLSWSRNPEADVVKYRIYYDIFSPPITLRDSTSSSADTTRTISGLLNGLSYTFRISAVNALGYESPLSNEAAAYPEGLIAFYPFTQGSRADSSGNSFDLIDIGAPLAVTDRLGMASSSLMFNGSDDYLRGPIDARIHPTAQVTVSAWINSDGRDGQQDVIVSTLDATPGGFQLAIGYSPTDDSLVFTVRPSSGSYDLVTAFQSAWKSQWTHVVGTYDGAALKYYVNGVLRKSMSGTGAIYYDNNRLRIASNEHVPNADRNYKGGLDDIRIYNRAISAAEVDSLYHIGGWGTPLFADSLALVDLYNSTNGSGWTNKTNWLTGPVDTWHGITVAGARVTEIVLSNNNLVGPIPLSVGNLSAVWKLDLGYNHFTGGLPATIGQMSALTDLIMWNSGLSGPLPAELGNLPELRLVYMQGNQISGSIPATLGNLPKLWVLELSNNQLTGPIPPELGSISTLVNLLVGNNQLTGTLPVELTNLSQLFALDFQNNRLTGEIPQQIGRLTRLTHLFLQNNQFAGAVPDSIRRLTLLQHLYLNNNRFVRLPNLTPLTSVQYLNVGGNRFTFGDLEPNAAVASVSFGVSPQDSIGTARDTVILSGSSVTFSATVDGTANRYQWYKGGNIVPSGTSSTLTLSGLTAANNGHYTCAVTNTIVAGLTISTRPVGLTVQPTLPGEYTADANTVLLLHMNEQVGSTVVDASGFGNNGSVVTGSVELTGRFGSDRLMVNPAGATGIVVPHAASLNFGSGAFTAEGWYRVQQTSTASGFMTLTKFPGLPSPGWYLTLSNGNASATSEVFSGTTAGERTGLMDSRSLADGRWHHIASVISPTVSVLYVDGVERGRSNVTPQGSTDNTGDLVIGMWSGVWSVSVDEVRISNVARSPQEFNLQLPPVNLTANAVGTTIGLGWQNGGGAVGLLRYKIYRGADSTSMSLVDSTTNTAFSNAGLAVGSTYFYRISAVDVTGFEGARSSAASATTTAASPPPGTPILASPLNGAVNVALTPTLRWRSSATATSYRLQVSPVSDFTALNIDNPSLTDTSFTIPGSTLNNNQAYYWRVLAANTNGASAFSSAWSFTTIPTIPAQVTLQSPSNGAVTQPLNATLSWNGVATASSYRIQISTAVNFSTLVMDSSGHTGTSIQATGLQYATIYYWRVLASNGAGNGPYSSSWIFTTLIAAPAVPSLALPADAAVDQPTSVRFVWNAAARATAYDLAVSTDAAFATTFTNPVDIADTSFTVNGLAQSTTYYWRVTAKNSGGTAASSTRHFTTAGSPPAQAVLSSPSNGAANIPLDGQVLSWTGVANATSYRLQVSTDALFNTSLVDDSTLTATSRQIFGLQSGAVYYWRVRAKNAAGYGPFSATWSFTALAGAPSSPTPALPGNGAQNQPLTLTLSWGSSAGASTYEVQVSTSSGFSPLVYSTTGLTGTSVQPTGLTNSTLYYWRVRAVNAGGASAYSAAFSFTTVIALPDPPTLVSPGNGAAATTTSLTMSWSAAARASSYDLEVALDAGFSNIRASAFGLTSTSHQVDNLLPLTQYFWRVKANNAGGSTISGTWQFTTRPAIPAVPVLVAPLNGATGVPLTPTLTWNPSSGAVGYQMQIATSNAFTPPLTYEQSTTGTSLTPPIMTLQYGTGYYWRVRAYNFYDTSAYASWAFTTTIAVPNAPQILSPSNGAQNQSPTLTLVWQRPSGATTYHVQFGLQPDLSVGALIDDSTRVDTSLNVSNLSLGSTYYWRIRARNVAGWSLFSPVVSFSVLSAPPQTPTMLGATALPGRKVTVSWMAGGGLAQSYRVERRNGGSFSEIAVVPGDQSGATDSLLTETITYTYRVRAYNAVGFSSYSTEASATVLDETAPPAPMNLSVSGSGWQRQSPITITWTGPTDPSGTPMAWYNLGFAPTVGNPGSSVAVSGTSVMLPWNVQGNTMLYLYLQDGAGNKNPASAAGVSVSFDNIPPVITHDSNAVATFSTSSPQPIMISAGASDVGSGVQSLLLQSRRAGTPWSLGQQQAFLNLGGSTVSLPQEYIALNRYHGVDYRIVATDGAGNVRISPTYSVRIQISDVVERRDPQTGSPVAQASVTALPSSAPKTYAYRMFSVPLDLTNKTPQDVFEVRTGLPAYNDESWRFYKLKDNVGNNASDPFDEYPGFRTQSVLTPGRAFLLILKSGTVVRTGPGTMLKAEDYNKTGIALNAGYNFVGNPFAFDIHKDSLRLADGSTLTGHTAAFIGVGGEQSGWRLNPDTLKAWEGWVVKLPFATSLRFNIADRASTAVPDGWRAVAAEDPGTSWRIRVDATRADNGVVDIGNIAGIDGRASEGDDEFDMFEPPLVGSGALSVGFETEEGVNAYDVRSNDKQERAWGMVLRTPEPRVDVALTFTGIDGAGQPVYLFDLDTRTGMRLVNGEPITVNSRSGMRRFRLVVGSEAFVEQNSDGISLVPKTTALHQNFPNPFNPETNLSFTVEQTGTATVTVFNVLGQEVTSLFTGTATAGRLYEVTFDARSLPSGVYFARLEAGKERKMVKMVLNR
jgi:fibronectin type 3 domain-containing protein